MSEKEGCPLCETDACGDFHRDSQREYRQCTRCELVFVPAAFLPTRRQEKAHYDLHQNDPSDPRYRKFLRRLGTPLMQRLAPGACGLDFGSGPGPTLSRMLVESGFPTTVYDPFYAADETIWSKRYDFITASEVVEHLHRPGFELNRLWSLLKSGGIMGIMTKRVQSVETFSTWHYKNDPTHVVFFSATTFRWLADYWSANLEIVGADVVLFHKP